MAERHNPEISEVLVGQLSNDAFIDVIFNKALNVLRHAERFEPIRNLLHGDHQGPVVAEFWTTATKSLH
jgi:hypothetical protein